MGLVQKAFKGNKHTWHSQIALSPFSDSFRRKMSQFPLSLSIFSDSLFHSYFFFQALSSQFFCLTVPFLTVLSHSSCFHSSPFPANPLLAVLNLTVSSFTVPFLTVLPFCQSPLSQSPFSRM